jgi:uncharacterized protein YceH (UPF0502 family)
VADLPVELTAAQARVVGALLEKELTTPDAYPMTLNALTTACNQTSNRDPVVRWSPQEVETTALALKAKGLARVVHPGSGERATKYRQVLDEVLELGAAERALVAVLLLRGPQTVAELRTRTERLHPFGSASEVEAALDELSRRDPPLVTRVGRQAGQKEVRWTALLEPGAAERAAVASTTSAPAAGPRAGRVDELEARVAALEERLAALEQELAAGR